jgi:hypothetical protein
MNVVSRLCLTLVPLAAVGALLSIATNAEAARIKCWTNKEGFRECGNVVPPEYVQKGHREVSKGGLTVKTQKRALTAKEKANRSAQEEADRQASLKAEKTARQERRRRLEQTAVDRTLLDLYVTEKDLTLAHERKVVAIKSTIKHRRSHVSKLDQQLARFQKQAANKERAGQEQSGKLLDNINDIQGQIDVSELFIRKRYQEMERLDAEYRKDLARYQYLKTGGRIGSPLTS